jgi:hypothetical protein
MKVGERGFRLKAVNDIDSPSYFFIAIASLRLVVMTQRPLVLNLL